MQNCLAGKPGRLTPCAANRSRCRSEDSVIKLDRDFDSFLFLDRFAHAIDQMAATVANGEMLIENPLVTAFDQTVEIIGDERVERPATQHFAGRGRADDSPFDRS